MARLRDPPAVLCSGPCCLGWLRLRAQNLLPRARPALARSRRRANAALQRAGSRHGVAAAARVLAFADGLAESPGESRSRVAMLQLGLPAPVLQWRVQSAAGVELGRVDFGWPELDTVGEFDGKVKYGRLLRPGQSVGEVLFAEKQREDAVRDEGKRFVRWIWPELDPFDPVAGRLRRAFDAR